jgi:DNA-binding HxlR family transcriptional regulator
MFLVAPPGGSKSELLMSLGLAEDHVHLCSSLTPHALVSGANLSGGQDPSLLPLLDQRVLVIKDFTTTLSMHPTARDEIFGQLRDAYDGRYEKAFGNGIFRSYESRFGILAGVTPNIDSFSSLHAGLGERFMKFRLERDLNPEDERQRIARAISNINQETGMREALQQNARWFLNSVKVGRMPVVPEDIQRRIIDLAMVASRLRGVVYRDAYRDDLIHAKASHELGTRIGKQLTKLAMGCAIFWGMKKVDERCFGIVAQVAMSSVPDKTEEIIYGLYTNGPTTVKKLQQTSDRLTPRTIDRALDDLRMLGVARRKGAHRAVYRLSSDMRHMLDECGAFSAYRRKPRPKKLSR